VNSPIDFTQQFVEALKSLNPAQRLAVDNIEGPIMVLAGPGTGKTHLLSARIGNILNETDAMPNNILCLTYTEAGMKAMRDRLLKLIGPDAHKIHIFTFHAFCNLVIKESPELFGNYELELISDIEKIEIIEKIIDNLPFNHPLVKNINTPYTNVSRLINLFTNIKKESWEVADLKQKIEKYLAEIPFLEQFIYKVNRKNIKKGDPKTSDIEAETQKMRTLSAAIELYPIYLQSMKEKNRYDYDDMVLWVIKAFKENERVLRNYQEKYQYLLVDEFQDTNGAQNEILQLLTSYWDSPNIFIVGDDDQSIYEFQGARLKSMIDFYEQYKDSIKVIVLKENYRSSQNILDCSATLIANNTHRIVNEIENHTIDKQLIAKNNEVNENQTPVVINAYNNHYQEVISVVEQIIALQNKGELLSEIAVLYAKNNQSKYLKKYLQYKNIPYESSRKVNILEEPLIQQWRLLLEYLALEFDQPHSGQHLLYRIFHFQCWDIPQKTIDTITKLHSNSELDGWLDILETLDEAAIVNFLQYRATLLSSLGNEALGYFLEQSLNLSGILNVATTKGNVSWQLTVLNTFLNYCQKEIQKKPKTTLKELVAGIANLENNNLGIEKEQIVSGSNAVQLLTAHGSKGLEFKHVFLLDVMGAWEKDSNRGNRNFSLPYTITFGSASDELEARRRLFFVAITRAKSTLQIGYSKFDFNGKPAQYAQFIDEIRNIPSTISQEILFEESKMVDLQIGLLKDVQPKITIQNQEVIQKSLSNFSLSVHSLNSYLRCPLSFYYDYVLKLPSGIVPATVFGNCLHKWLEWLFVEMKKSPDKTFESVEKSILYFEKALERNKGLLSKNDFERYLNLGKSTVEAYYLQHIGSWNKNVEIELHISKVLIDNIPVNGVIDKITYDENRKPTIIDYKSGTLDSNKLKGIKQNSEGGDYRRQLWLYKLMYENYRPHLPKVDSGIIAYLQKNQDGVFPSETIVFDKEEEMLFKQIIKTVYQKIIDLEFEPGCGKIDCKWCNFAKSNQPIDTFAEEDFLDD